MTVSRTYARKHRKAKKSYTLSTESVAFLEATRKKRRARSVSSVLEEILQAVRRAQAKEALGRAVTEYYDSLTDQELEEQRQWGEFALRNFPIEDI